MNLLSYLGMSLQSEVCLWTLLGLIRNIFDATLFKVNANLKQVWQMSMPEELSTSMQGVLRTMISGVMLVQCFTVYVYVATYIVLLYPVFLEERPALVLPWLLVAAIRKLLCELTSLALGLGTCVLLGASRPPCVKFVIVKILSIMPSFYMWMMMLSYYNALKVVAVFKTFPVPTSHCDYGLELAIRRRRTKSLLGEDQLRRKLLASFYGQHSVSNDEIGIVHKNDHNISRMVHATDTKTDYDEKSMYVIQSTVESSKRPSDTVSFEEWCINDIVIPRDIDRILEQFVLMSLRVSAYLKTADGAESMNSQNVTLKTSETSYRQDALHCAAITADVTDNPLHIGSIKGSTASYLKEYPQIFMKKSSYDQTPQNIQKPISNSDEASLETFDSYKIIEQCNSDKKNIFEVVAPHDVSICSENLNRNCSAEMVLKENTNASPKSDLSKSVDSFNVLNEKFNEDNLSENKEVKPNINVNDHGISSNETKQ